MEALTISHVMLGVTDMHRSLDFYRDTLGLTLRQQIPGFAFLECGGVTLALSEPVARASQQLVGASVVVFGVRNVKATYGDLHARGVSFLGEPFNVDGTNWGANFTDPDGHILSIFGPEGQA